MKSPQTNQHLLGRVRVAAILCAALPATSALAQLDVGLDAEASAGTEQAADESAATDSPPTEEVPDSTPAEEPTAKAEAELTDPGSEEAPLQDEEVPPAVVDVPEKPESGLWEALRSDDNTFGWDFGMEMDVGYADYRFDTPTYRKETFHDFRGQAWIAPTFEHRFGSKKQAFIRGSIEFVAWLREEQGIYQVNVFDAYAATGVKDIFDLSVGRVTTWRVIQPGNGFDIYTLEDTGALEQPNIQGQNFAAKRYELDDIWLRDTPGRAVLRIKPLKKVLPAEWNDLGLEVTGEYGKKNVSNIVGARGSVIYDHKWLRLAGGAEYQTSKRAYAYADPDDPPDSGTICQQCDWRYNNGLGGSVVFRPPYIEGGLNYADRHAVARTSAGVLEDSGIEDTTTRGGYIELHTGHLLASTKDGPRPNWLADQRSENIRRLRIGFGQKRTEYIRGNGDFKVHEQMAAYLKYNLGFNEAYLKAVVSKADGYLYDLVSAEGAPAQYTVDHGDMLAARLRFAYFF